jgi:hypothetical protein
MNRWQIICPVVAIAIFALATALIHGRKEHDYFIRMTTYGVGRDIIETTNSSHLIKIGPGLQARLSELLVSPTHIATVLLGDEPPPIGDGSACSRLVLTNEVADGVVIRLRQADTPGTFHVVGFLRAADQSRQ